MKTTVKSIINYYEADRLNCVTISYMMNGERINDTITPKMALWEYSEEKIFNHYMLPGKELWINLD